MLYMFLGFSTGCTPMNFFSVFSIVTPYDKEGKGGKGGYFDVEGGYYECTLGLIEILGVYFSFCMTRPTSKYDPPIKIIPSHVCMLKNTVCTCLHQIKVGV